jgi:hypothetical protein
MLKIVDVADRGLRWSQPSGLRGRYELRSGDELVGTLVFRSAFGTLATAESGDGCWTFKRVGFWQHRATIRKCGEDADLAVFTNQTWGGGGTLEFPSGRRFRATTNFWHTNLEFVTEAGERLTRFDYGGFFRMSAAVEVSRRALQLPELPLFVLFGWYLAVMLSRDAAAAAAVAAS